MTGWLVQAIALILAPIAPAGDPPPKSPLDPAAERATFQLAPGLRIDLVAAEPQIESPVHCAFDERGRLWVVEMLDYPNGPTAGQSPAGRIKILEDTDGDGRFETANVFADRLLFANGVLPWVGGAIVTAAPHILLLKDTDGDGKADRRDVLYEGFTAGNPQLRVSHPALGPDGWVYVANGLRGGEVRRSGQPGAPAIAIGGKDFRFDLVHDRAEAIPGMGQFGNTFDRWGNRFVCDNRNHLRHVVFPTDPGRRNPLLGARPLLEDPAGPADGPLSSGRKVYPLSRNWTTSNLHASRFTAACGVFADQGNLLPSPYAGGVFTCEPTGNLVRLEKLEPTGSSFQSQPWRDGVEFLATPDEWFRPVSMAQAPDGSLLLVDMYRAVIEHPEFMPTELKNRPDLLLGNKHGRIWRIAPETSTPGQRKLTLNKLPTTDLIRLLEHPNGWQRTTAQRLLLSKSGPEITEGLSAFSRKTFSPDGLILSAWLLTAKAKSPPADVFNRMKSHEHPRVREHAVRLLEEFEPATLVELSRDADPRVRFQVALSLGTWDDDRVIPVLAQLAERDSGDRWTRVAITSSAGKRTAQLVAKLFQNPDFKSRVDEGRLELARDLCEIVGSSRDAAAVGLVIDALADQDQRWQRGGLVGICEGVARRGSSVSIFFEKLPEPSLAAKLLVTAARPAGDPKADEAERLVAVRLLAHARWSEAGPELIRLFQANDTPPLIQQAAVRSLAVHLRPEVTKLMLAGMRGRTPTVRAAILDGLLARTDGIKALLDAVEARQIKPGDLDPARVKRLTSVRDPALAARAQKLLKDFLPADRQQVLAAYRSALTLPADPQRGREVFKRACAACHAVAGVGTTIGPDISDTRTKTPEMLLTDIINPNAAVDGNFLSYTVNTLDGKVLTGLISAESAAGITLKQENGQTATVLRADIDEVKSSGLSLMPEGLEKSLTVQEMADLIRFLKDWRYQDGADPRK